jgi:hypothetical protein
MNNLRIKYYVLIDEYDNFANNILIHHGKQTYLSLTHGAGFLRSFFAAIKAATETRTIERMFVTGVSPLVLSDVTSGMNIGDHISNEAPFNSMAGFTQAEVETMLDYYIKEKVIPENQRKEILTIFKENYDHYVFSKNGEKIYNSDMILYFFNVYFQEKEIPNNLIDSNIRTDYGKLRFLIVQDQKIQSKVNGNFSILRKLIENNETKANLTDNFYIEEIIEKNKFKSFLYYLGLLTIKKHVYGMNYVLTIPNKTIETMHFEYIRGALKDAFGLDIDIDYIESLFMEAAFEGRFKGLFEHIFEKFYKAVSLRDFIIKEVGIKLFLLAYLNLSPLYFIESEPEMKSGYADLFFRKNYATTDMTKYEYLVELKYLNSEESKETEKNRSKISELKKQAINQLEQYSKSRNITCKLKKIVIISSSKELVLIEEIV